MKSNVGSTIMAVGTLAAVALFGGTAEAQNGGASPAAPYPSTTTTYPTMTTTQYRAPVGAEQAVWARPNTFMLGGGALAFLGAYVPSFVVAASSDHDGDKWLYFPIAGPWIDLASRGCDTNIETNTCGTNAFDRAALIGSGVVQALGVGAMLFSFATPQKKVVATHATVHFGPASFARGSGVMAFGNF